MDSSKIENYLIQLNLNYEDMEENAWLINDDSKGLEQVIVFLADPLVLFRVKIMEVPSKDREGFYRKLLELNFSDLIHGAYAIEGDDVLLVDSLQYSTMDLEEFQASLDAIGLAMAQHYPVLSEYRN